MSRRTVLALFILLISAVSLSAQDVYIGPDKPTIGSVNDSFNRDYRKSPFPRDNNTSIITSTDILKNIPQEQSIDKVFVSKFDFYGNRIFNKNVLENEIINYTQRNLDLAELYEAADVITKLYQSSGYLSSYAYIPPQIVDNQMVIINIVEAQIGNVMVYGASDYKKDFIADHLYLLSSGIVLKTSSLERKLLLLNSYPGLEARATLKAGTKAGTTDILIYVKDTNPYTFSFSIDDYGSESTNIFRFNAVAAIGNVITSGDRLALTLSLGLDSFINAIAGTDTVNPLQLFYLYADYRLPIGSDGFKLGINFTLSNYVATGVNYKPLDLNGNSTKIGIYAEYPIILTYSFSLKAMIRLYRLAATDNAGALNAELFSDTLYKASLIVTGDFFPWYYSGGYFTLMYEQGFNQLFGGSNFSANSSNQFATGTPSIITIDANFYQYLSRYFRLDLTVNGQYTNSTLLSTDRYYLGGVYSVRGYSNSYKVGDYGVRFSAEARVNLFSERWQIFAFFDGGFVGTNPVDGPAVNPSAFITSVGGGTRFYPYKGFIVSIEYGLPLNLAETFTFKANTIYARIGYEF